MRGTFKSNVGLIPGRGLSRRRPLFAFRAADSWWGMVVVEDALGQQLGTFFLHLGRDCVMPLRPGGKSVFETVNAWCSMLRFPVAKIKVCVQSGIGPCCYRFGDKQRIAELTRRVTERYGADAVQWVIVPYTDPYIRDDGRAAFNIGALIVHEVGRVWGGTVVQVNIAMDDALDASCTACDPPCPSMPEGEPPGNYFNHKGMLYSSARGDGANRNFIVVHL